jgi:hypothetical protein
MTPTSNDSDPSRLVRIGTVITPDEFAGMVEPSAKLPPLTHRALLFYAPPHVVRAFEAPGETLSHRVVVHPTEDGLDHIMVMTIQRLGVLLHCVLPLSDVGVQGYVADCIDQRSIRLVLPLDDTTRFAVLELESSFDHRDRLAELMKTARPTPGGVVSLLSMTQELLELPPTWPWALESPVHHLVGVLVGTNVAAELRRTRPEAMSNGWTTQVH